MQKVGILTDSACDLPPELQRRYQIDILNFHIIINGKNYEERKDFMPNQFYSMLAKVQSSPTTEIISASEYLSAYQRYSEADFTDLLIVTIASSVSQTNNNAHLALTRFYAQYPESTLRLHIIDSKLFSMGYGYPLCIAAAMLQQGIDVNAVISYLEDCFSRIELVFAAYTCKYLKMSGRTKGFAAFVGDLFRLRPMMSYIDGISRAESSVQGNKGVIPAMCEYAGRRIDRSQPYLVGTTMDSHGKLLIDECSRTFGYAPQMVFDIGCSLATHLGPEGDAIVFFGDKRN